MKNTICNYCKKEKEGLSFFIGASTKPDWTMVYGTGKMTCPDCYNKAMAEGKERVELHKISNMEIEGGGLNND